MINDKKLSLFEWLGFVTGGLIVIATTVFYGLFLDDFGSIVASNQTENILKFASSLFILGYGFFSVISFSQLIELLFNKELSTKDKQLRYGTFVVVWLMTLILRFTSEPANLFALLILNLTVVFIIVVCYKGFSHFYNK